jgi:SAM-dependent methyltransferase
VNSKSNTVINALRDEWNDLSRKNAFHFINSAKSEWREDEFLMSGEYDVHKFVDPFLSRKGFDAHEKTMLEIGCGVGRMSVAFARRFGTVEAADISSEMIAQAKDRQQRLQLANVRFQVVSGQDLGPYSDGTMDFCFSYIVFQHIPDISVIINYIREIGRVLKKGGIALFQVNGFHRVKFPSGRFLYWGICDTGRLRKLGVKTRPCLRFGKLNSWDGVPVSLSEMQRACADANLTDVQFGNVGTQYMWVSGKKQ